MYNYSCVKSPYPVCSFGKGYIVDEMEYRKRKAEAFRIRVVSSREAKWKERFEKSLVYLKDGLGLTDPEIGEIIGVTPKIIQHTRERMETPPPRSQ